ncbi:MAG: DUF2235 domain-containing protein [Boseongicola sp.]|nr:DUF2235 domain-containing protein [Boseongicola sp.]
MASPQKNIVICLDGTGNQIEENLSNVLKLYRAVSKTDTQIVYYDQGVGTLRRALGWGWLKQKVRLILGMAFGYGLDGNVLRAYEFLVRYYEERGPKRAPVRDRIYIFGFSRGAYTARVLAGLIYEIGILKPEQLHLAPAALMAYKQTIEGRRARDAGDKNAYEGEGANFRRVAQPINGSVQFLGLFDTVSSVFMPNPNGFLPPFVRARNLHTRNNPAVEVFRHAVSVDERRRMYRAEPWDDGQFFQPSPYATDPDPQDAEGRWFAGFHSDVGGGYERRHSGASQYPLIWMLDAARAAGLEAPDRMVNYLTGITAYSSTTTYLYPQPSLTAKLHHSGGGLWALLEIIPKRVHPRMWPERKSILGYYLPLFEPRLIAGRGVVDRSVYDRIAEKRGYKPENVPDAPPTSRVN